MFIKKKKEYNFHIQNIFFIRMKQKHIICGLPIILRTVYIKSWSKGFKILSNILKKHPKNMHLCWLTYLCKSNYHKPTTIIHTSDRIYTWEAKAKYHHSSLTILMCQHLLQCYIQLRHLAKCSLETQHNLFCYIISKPISEGI